MMPASLPKATAGSRLSGSTMPSLNSPPEPCPGATGLSALSEQPRVSEKTIKAASSRKSLVGAAGVALRRAASFVRVKSTFARCCRRVRMSFDGRNSQFLLGTLAASSARKAALSMGPALYKRRGYHRVVPTEWAG
jgi:hypothetical protein